jgi:hypothetical protein
MLTMSRDTSPEAEKVLIELLRAAPVSKRIHMLLELNASMRDLSLIRLQKSYPQEPLVQLRKRLAREVYGESLADAAWRVLDQRARSDHA